MMNLVNMPLTIVADVRIPNIVTTLVKAETAGWLTISMKYEMLLLILPQEVVTTLAQNFNHPLSANDSCAELSFAESALTGDEIMGLAHKEYPIQGVQFHPESFATEGAKRLLSNFLLQV